MKDSNAKVLAKRIANSAAKAVYRAVYISIMPDLMMAETGQDMREFEGDSNDLTVGLVQAPITASLESSVHIDSVQSIFKDLPTQFVTAASIPSRPQTIDEADVGPGFTCLFK